MSIAEKLVTIAENEQKIYDKGVFDASPQETVSGEAIGITDISPIEHNMAVGVRGKNLLPYPYVQKTATVNGITFTDNGDGTITANGTATADATIELRRNIKLLKEKSYVISGCPSGGSWSTYVLCIQDMSYKQSVSDIGKGCAFTPRYENFYVYMRVIKGVTVENLVFKPMIEEGTTATSYVPYIADISTVKLYKGGKNLLSVGLVKGNFTPTSTSADNLSNQSGVISSYGFYLKAGAYVVSGIGDTYNLFINGMITTTKTSDYQVYQGTSRKFTIPTDGLYNLQFNKISGAEMLDIATLKVQVEIGSTATEYEPYIEPTIYDVQADGTVDGVKSLYPNTTLYTDTSGAVIDATYYQDGKKVKENLIDMILSLGGVINE